MPGDQRRPGRCRAGAAPLPSAKHHKPSLRCTGAAESCPMRPQNSHAGAGWPGPPENGAAKPMRRSGRQSQSLIQPDPPK
ncbi:hypothetical protein [Azospirillum endophyticum]